MNGKPDEERRADILDMRRRLWKERPPRGEWDLKLADGGLWLDRTNQTKGLEHVSNAKLLHLHETLTAIKEKFADRDALIAGIVDVEGRKDDTYKNRFASWPTPRLWDYYKSAAARAEA